MLFIRAMSHVWCTINSSDYSRLTDLWHSGSGWVGNTTTDNVCVCICACHVCARVENKLKYASNNISKVTLFPMVSHIVHVVYYYSYICNVARSMYHQLLRLLQIDWLVTQWVRLSREHHYRPRVCVCICVCHVCARVENKLKYASNNNYFKSYLIFQWYHTVRGVWCHL